MPRPYSHDLTRNSLPIRWCCLFLLVAGGTLHNVGTCQALSLTELSQSQQQTDRQIVNEQLGYLPRNYLSVSARNLEGSPIAIKTYPLQPPQDKQSKNQKDDDYPLKHHPLDISASPPTWGTPFPTHYWLTSPDIARAIGDIERFAYTKIIADYLNLDANVAKREQLLRCHQQCGHDRWDALDPVHRDFFEQYADDYSTVKRMRYFIQDSGIAGLNYQEKLDDDGHLQEVAIKCLHTHYGHFCSTSPDRRENDDTASSRANENPIGRIIHELLLGRYPDLIL